MVRNYYDKCTYHVFQCEMFTKKLALTASPCVGVLNMAPLDLVNLRLPDVPGAVPMLADSVKTTFLATAPLDLANLHFPDVPGVVLMLTDSVEATGPSTATLDLVNLR